VCAEILWRAQGLICGPRAAVTRGACHGGRWAGDQTRHTSEHAPADVVQPTVFAGDELTNVNPKEEKAGTYAYRSARVCFRMTSDRDATAPRGGCTTSHKPMTSGCTCIGV
jgi:hypothetical protein